MARIRPHLLPISACLCMALPCIAQVAAVTAPKHDVPLALTVPGRVATLAVKAGDRVKKDAILLALDDRAGESQVELYRLRAESTLAIDAAKAELALAELEEKRIKEAFEKVAAGGFEVERAQHQTNLARLRLSQATEQRDQAKVQLAAAEVAHQAFTLKAPIDGVIEEVIVSPGQTVEALKPVCRIVASDPLVIEAHVPTMETLRLAVNGDAWILPRGESSSDSAVEPVIGHIVHIAQVADARSDTRLVTIELANPQGRPAGTHVTVSFTPPARR